MAQQEWFRKEQLLYFKYVDIIVNKVSNKLRELFTKYWTDFYREKYGEWEDGKTGEKFASMEPWMNQTRRAKELKVMKEKPISEWDCMTLFYAILGSHLIGRKLTSETRDLLDDLRYKRNEMAHAGKGELSHEQFVIEVEEIKNSLQGLGCEIEDIEMTADQQVFLTENSDILVKKLAELEAELNNIRQEKNSFCHLPQKPAHYVTERRLEVQSIREKLCDLREKYPQGITTVYVSGNPGCGKSQVARQVGRSLYDEGGYDFIMTVNAESSSAFLLSMEKFVKELGFGDVVIALTGSQENKLRKLKSIAMSKLCKTYSYWLIIVDNVAGDNLTEFWPNTTSEEWGSGQVLLTTQDEDLVLFGDSSVAHEMLKEGMNFKDAIDLVSEISTVELEDDESAKFVYEKYDKQPLALAHAAMEVRFIIQKGRKDYSWSDFVRNLKSAKNKKRRCSNSRINQSNPVYKQSMYNATADCVRRFWEGDPIFGTAFHMLAYFSEHVVPIELVSRYVYQVDSSYDMEQIKARLCECSVLLQHEATVMEDDGGKCSFQFINMHQVVGQAMQDITQTSCRHCNKHLMTSEDHCLYKMLTLVAEHLESLNAKAAHTAALMRRTALEHLPNMASKLPSNLTVTENSQALRIIQSIESLANYTFTSGDLAVTKKFLEWTVHMRKQFQGPREAEVGFALAKLGRTLGTQKELHHAKDNCLLGLRILEEKNDYIKQARVLSWLAVIEEDLGDIKGAKILHLKAISLGERAGIDEKDLISFYNSLALSEHRLGQLKESKDTFKKTEDLLRKAKGNENNLEMARLLNNLGWLLCNTRELDEAIESLKKALELLIDVYGENTYRIAYPYINLGIAHRLKGNFMKALEYSLKSTNVFKNTFGDDNMEYGEATDYLGMVFYELGDLTKASECHKVSLALWEKYSGTPHLKKARFLENAANVEAASGNFRKARELYELSLKIRKEISKERYTVVDNCHNQLGTLLAATDKVDEGQILIEDGLKLNQAILGPQSPVIAESYFAKGNVLKIMGKTVEAEQIFNTAISIFMDSPGYGANHYRYADCLNELGHIALLKDNAKIALERHETAYHIYKSSLGDKHPKIGHTLIYKGISKLRLGDNSSGSDCEAGLTMLTDQFGSNHWHLVRFLLVIAEEYLLLDMKDIARKFVTQAEDICNNLQVLDHLSLKRIQGMKKSLN